MSEETEWGDQWDTSSGLPLDDSDVAVIETEFCYNNEITAGAVFLRVKFAFEGEKAEQDPAEKYYSVGKDWRIADKGARIESEIGPRHKTSENSNLGRLINAIKKLPGTGAALGSRDPHSADFMMGTRWHLNEVKFENTLSKRGESSLPLPSKFNGMVESASANGAKANASTKKASGASKAAEAKARAELAKVGALTDELRAELTALAVAAEDHDAFMAAAFELDDVSNSPEVGTAVLSSGPGSIWHDAQNAATADA